MEKLYQILKQYRALSLEDLKEARLMNRVDTKFVVSISKLPEIINALVDFYFTLEIKEERNIHYQNLYFDTPENQFYINHHNGKENRFKVRFRKYAITDSTYLEVKKRHKKRTTKQRIDANELAYKLTENEKCFIKNRIGEIAEVHPSLMVEYNRITLINKNLKERFTIDYDIKFTKENQTKSINHVLIAELKQHKFNKYSPAYQLMKQFNVNPSRFSKYCIGRILLSNKKEIKYNNFKNTLLQLNKLKV